MRRRKTPLVPQVTHVDPRGRTGRPPTRRLQLLDLLKTKSPHVYPFDELTQAMYGRDDYWTRKCIRTLVHRARYEWQINSIEVIRGVGIRWRTAAE